MESIEEMGMGPENCLERELSRELAENIFRIRKAVAIRESEDFLLLTQQICRDVPYFTRGGVLRLSRRGVFVYGVSDGERQSCGGGGAYEYTRSTFFHDLGGIYDDDGIRLAKENPAAECSMYRKDTSVRVMEDGTLAIPENYWPGKLLTDFIEDYTPSSLVGSKGRYDPDSGGCDRWGRLGGDEKRSVVQRLVDGIESAFLLKYPGIGARLRYRRSQ